MFLLCLAIVKVWRMLDAQDAGKHEGNEPNTAAHSIATIPVTGYHFDALKQAG